MLIKDQFLVGRSCVSHGRFFPLCRTVSSRKVLKAKDKGASTVQCTVSRRAVRVRDFYSERSPLPGPKSELGLERPTPTPTVQ
jgi:hypothetical protein